MITAINRIILTFGLLLSSFFAISQNADFDKDSVLVGDTVYLNLMVDIGKSKTIIFPAFKDTLVKGIEVIHKPYFDTIDSGKTLRQRTLVQVWEPGEYRISGIPFLVSGDTVYANQVILKVLYFQPDSAFLAKIDTSQVMRIVDIKEPIQTPWTFQEFWELYSPYILGALIFLLIGAAVTYFIIRKMKNKPIFIPQKPQEPAHVTALRELENLNQKKLWQNGFTKEYYTELTDIFRNYIEGRYKIPAPEFTTNQLIAAIKHTKSINEDLTTKLRETFQTADLVKFAKMQTLPNENELYMNNTMLFIESTKEKEKIKEPEENDDIS